MLITLLIIHLLGACVWVGGHLAAATTLLPQAWEQKSLEPMMKFEAKFSKIEMPSLVLMIITGVWLSYLLGVTWEDWFHFANPIETAISIKIILLLLTLLTAASANIFVLPKAKKGETPLKLVTLHVTIIITLGVLLVIFGGFANQGGI